jgi:hypothetical protein
MENRKLVHIQNWIEEINDKWNLNLIEQEALEKTLLLIKESNYSKL